MAKLSRHIAALVKHYRLSESAGQALFCFEQLVMDVKQLWFVQREWRLEPGVRLATSLAAIELPSVRGALRMADFASGMGFPGLVLATVLPDAHVSLVEPEARQCEFLRTAAAAMHLTNVEVVQRRVERWKAGASACDLVTCRGLADLRVMVKKGAPLVAPSGALVLWGRAKRDAAWETGADAAAVARGLSAVTVHRTHPPKMKGRLLYVYQRPGL